MESFTQETSEINSNTNEGEVMEHSGNEVQGETGMYTSNLKSPVAHLKLHTLLNAYFDIEIFLHH